MSENRIRRTDSVQPASPGGSGVWVGATDNTPKYNPDGTTRYLSPIVASVPLEGVLVDKNVWIAPVACELVAAYFVPTVVGAAGTFQIEKCTGTTAPGSGTELLGTAFDCTATINTVQTGSLTAASTANKRFAAGNRVAIDVTGTSTNLVGQLTLLFKQV